MRTLGRTGPIPQLLQLLKERMLEKTRKAEGTMVNYSNVNQLRVTNMKLAVQAHLILVHLVEDFLSVIENLLQESLLKGCGIRVNQ